VRLDQQVAAGQQVAPVPMARLRGVPR
jgi:hypothetical protein